MSDSQDQDKSELENLKESIYPIFLKAMQLEAMLEYARRECDEPTGILDISQREAYMNACCEKVREIKDGLMV